MGKNNENEVKFDYVKNEDGSSEFEKFVSSISKKDKVKLLSVIQKTQEYGLIVATRMEWIKKLDGDLYELRSKVGNNIQRALYFQKVDNQYVITHGFTKKTQKTPVKEIEKAKKIRDKYKKEN